jgi:hypothetical protein
MARLGIDGNVPQPRADAGDETIENDQCRNPTRDHKYVEQSAAFIAEHIAKGDS